MRLYLLIFIFLIIKISNADIGSVPGTVNQLENDPAQESVEQETDELYEAIDELNEPQEQGERVKEVKPTHHYQDEPQVNQEDE